MRLAQVQTRSAEPIQSGGLEKADRLWHLKRAGLAEGLTQTELQQLALACIDRVFAKEETIYHQDRPANTFYILNRGTVRTSACTGEGREKITGFLRAGSVFGVEVISPGRRRTGQAVAHRESWVFQIEMEALLNLMRQIPALNWNLVQVLNAKLREAMQEIEILSFRNTEQRLAYQLIKLCDEHGRELVTRHGLVKLPISVSHEQLAQLIGANRPHVSSIMSELRREGCIDYQKRKLIIHPGKLGGHFQET